MSDEGVQPGPAERDPRGNHFACWCGAEFARLMRHCGGCGEHRPVIEARCAPCDPERWVPVDVRDRWEVA